MCVRADRADDTGIGQGVLGSGIVNPIGGIAGMNMVLVPDLGALTAKKLKNPAHGVKQQRSMQRYFSCSKKSKKGKIEFVEGTPVEILSPLYKHLQPLPKEKQELLALDFEVVEQIHLLEAEYNKRFQDAKHHISKNDMAKGLHYMSQSKNVKKRITELEKRHTDILDALETIVLSETKIPAYRVQAPSRKSSRQSFESPPTPN